MNPVLAAAVDALLSRELDRLADVLTPSLTRFHDERVWRTLRALEATGGTVSEALSLFCVLMREEPRGRIKL